jgi:hypothetical protein
VIVRRALRVDVIVPGGMGVSPIVAVILAVRVDVRARG